LRGTLGSTAGAVDSEGDSDSEVATTDSTGVSVKGGRGRRDGLGRTVRPLRDWSRTTGLKKAVEGKRNGRTETDEGVSTAVGTGRSRSPKGKVADVDRKNRKPGGEGGSEQGT